MGDTINISHNLHDGKLRTKDVLLDKQVKFESLLLREEIQSGLQKNGFTYLSPIQRHSLPLSLTGCSIIVHAKCGTGKTLIFAISSLYSILVRQHQNLQCIILAPTREIAAQNAEVINKVGCDIKDMNMACCIGGRSLDDDMKKVEKCQIVVGTPGRINHLIELGAFKTNAVRLLVLDEVDQLFCDTFEGLVMKIVSHLPPQKQIIACCATLSADTYRVLCRITNDFKYVSQNGICKFGESSTPNVLIGLKHYIAPVVSDSTSLNTITKRNKLLEILKYTSYNQCFVFVNYITQTGSICNFLNNNGIYARCISSNQDQATRLEVMNYVKNNYCHVLVTTDLAARGVDIYNANLVVNMSIPYPPICYLHRIGRAGRFGSQGNVVTILYEGREVNFFSKLVSSVITEPVNMYILPTVINRNIIDYAEIDSKSCTITPRPDVQLNEDMPSCWKNLIKATGADDEHNDRKEFKATTTITNEASVEDTTRIKNKKNKKKKSKKHNNNNTNNHINSNNNNNNNKNMVAIVATPLNPIEDANREIGRHNSEMSRLKEFIEQYRAQVYTADISDERFKEKFINYLQTKETPANANATTAFLDETSIYQPVIDEIFRRKTYFENLTLHDFDIKTLLTALEENCVLDLSSANDENDNHNNNLEDDALDLSVIVKNIIGKMKELTRSNCDMNEIDRKEVADDIIVQDVKVMDAATKQTNGRRSPMEKKVSFPEVIVISNSDIRRHAGILDTITKKMESPSMVVTEEEDTSANTTQCLPSDVAVKKEQPECLSNDPVGNNSNVDNSNKYVTTSLSTVTSFNSNTSKITVSAVENSGLKFNNSNKSKIYYDENKIHRDNNGRSSRDEVKRDKLIADWKDVKKGNLLRFNSIKSAKTSDDNLKREPRLIYCDDDDDRAYPFGDNESSSRKTNRRNSDINNVDNDDADRDRREERLLEESSFDYNRINWETIWKSHMAYINYYVRSTK